MQVDDLIMPETKITPITNSQDFDIPAVTQSELARINIRIIVAERYNQSTLSRLVEFITGYCLDNPDLINRLIEDQKIVRRKYDLPPRDILFDDPSEYERRLRAIAKELGIEIIQKTECGNFFQDYSAGGVFVEDRNAIGISIMRNDQLDQFLKDLVRLEHEIIHAFQHLRYPRMPIELQEYEAYVANRSIMRLLEFPDESVDFLFGYFILGSVLTFYKELNDSQHNGQEVVKPIWKDPMYFLRKDGLTDEQVATAVADLGLSRK